MRQRKPPVHRQLCNWPWRGAGGTPSSLIASHPRPSPCLQVRHQVTADPLVQCHTASESQGDKLHHHQDSECLLCVCVLGIREVPLTHGVRTSGWGHPASLGPHGCCLLPGGLLAWACLPEETGSSLSPRKPVSVTGQLRLLQSSS